MAEMGDCFVNAVRFMLDESIDNPKRHLTLVHASVVGTGGDVKGVKYAHAFIIERLDIPHIPGTQHIGDPYMEMCIDPSIDFHNPNVFPLGLYRNLGEVTNEIHYSRGEMREMLRLHEHYGPWDESVVSDADRKARGE